MTIHRDGVSTTDHTFCAWCGAGLVSAGQFCARCGRAVVEAQIPDAPPAEWVDEFPDNTGALPQDDTSFFQFEEVAPSELPRSRRQFGRRPSRRWIAIGSAALALLLLVTTLAIVGYGYLRNQPVREAFAGAQATFGSVVEAFEEANDVEQVGFASQEAGDAVGVLTGHREAAFEVDSELTQQVVPLIDAQLLFAQAGAALGALDPDDLAVWGEAHASLSAALVSLESARQRLATTQPDLAAQLPSTTAVLGHLEAVVGGAVAEAAETSLASLLDHLSLAKTTADVREAAETAARDGETTRAATAGLAPGSAEEKELQSFSKIYSALATLGTLDADTLTEWGTARQTLTVGFAETETGSPVAVAGDKALTALNRLVNRARTRLSDWQVEYDAAVASRATDTAGLAEYRTGMEAQMRAYSALRSDLSEWIERVESPSAYVTYDEGYSVLSQAQWDRQMVRDEMNGLAVPAEVQGAHAQLVVVVDDAIAAVQSAYDGVDDADYCINSCYYKDTPGWINFRAESGRITDAYRTADETWQAAVGGAESALAKRDLPRRPQV